jgi:hypothetical protein
MSAPLIASPELQTLVKAQRTARPWVEDRYSAAAITMPAAVSDTAMELAYRAGGARLDELAAIRLQGSEAHLAGQLSERELTLLDAACGRRRETQLAKRAWWRSLGGVQISPPRDRAAAQTRRRALLRMGLMPPHVAQGLTAGEEAVAAIYAEDYRRQGFCDDSKEQLAHRAGVVKRVVQRAQAALNKFGLIRIEQRERRGDRHETTLVKIADPAWRRWLSKRGLADWRSPRGPGGVGDCLGDRSVIPLLQTQTIENPPEPVARGENTACRPSARDHNVAAARGDGPSQCAGAR